jgi:hypothetical protein
VPLLLLIIIFLLFLFLLFLLFLFSPSPQPILFSSSLSFFYKVPVLHIICSLFLLLLIIKCHPFWGEISSLWFFRIFQPALYDCIVYLGPSLGRDKWGGHPGPGRPGDLCMDIMIYISCTAT